MKQLLTSLADSEANPEAINNAHSLSKNTSINYVYLM
jgi:hypothetical protein